MTGKLAAEALAHLARIANRAPAEFGDLSRLTERETEILGMISAGRTDRETAAVLSISVRTVQTHVSNVLHKLGVRRRAEAARLYRGRA
jgi:two-component system nitrate/nitrite response regulator NarL